MKPYTRDVHGHNAKECVKLVVKQWITENRAPISRREVHEYHFEVAVNNKRFTCVVVIDSIVKTVEAV
jgi:hypothetical protein